MENDVCTSVNFTPGKRTLKNFLAAAMQPVGTVLYIYGGGWNYEDTGGNEQSVHIGPAPEWVHFFRKQDALFTYRDYYPIDGRNIYCRAGLDCSGYIGWAVYNTMHAESGGESYVIRAACMAEQYAKRYGWGTLSRGKPGCAGDGMSGRILRPGDIFSMEGHVWICVGMCGDGSAVILHSTPSESVCGCPGGGVQLGAIGWDQSCEAFGLADYYMSMYYPEWSRRYQAVLKDFDTYTAADSPGGRFRWFPDARGLHDPDGIACMDAAQVLGELFEQ